MYPRILVPTDGSECAAEAVAQGVRLAKALSSEVTFLFVVDIPSVMKDGMVTVDAAVRDMRRKGKESLESARQQAERVGTASSGEMVEGPPATQIAYAAEAFSLVVMGSHGTGTLRRVVLGSVVQAVLQLVTTPVLVVRCAKRGGEGSQP